ncbi:DUF2188 domain-containing protein [Hoeflea marina]|nr:DUF2188 domain-containing protein [Hoeflea marina]
MQGFWSLDQGRSAMKVCYEIVPHDGGWAYRYDGVYSETFSTHDSALAAARFVALEQQVGGESAGISYQDEDSNWHEEYADGGDRPEAVILDAGGEPDIPDPGDEPNPHAA